jgi:paraquat-inducible protein B
MKKANKTVIGAFVVGAIILLIGGLIAFGSGMFFKKSDKYILYFNRSIKGLSEGSPVVFKGVKLGHVSDITLVYDPQGQEELIAVTIDVSLSLVHGVPEKIGYPDYERFIKNGLRAKLDIQSFVTGQLMVAFSFYPDTSPKLHNLHSPYPEVPTLPTPPGILAAMDEVPIKEIFENLNQILSVINKTISSQGFSELDRTIRELTATARAVRFLVEYLEAHPEAFLKGKQASKLKGE